MISIIAGEKSRISTREKGITLIALVVTIIVLLILAGVPSNAIFYVDKNSTDKRYKNNDGNILNINIIDDTVTSGRGSMKDTEKIKNLKPVSKQGVQVWNYITQMNAKMVSENMYKTSSSVGSYLIDSHAWNAICKVMIKRKVLTEEDMINSTKWGNFHNNTTAKFNKINGLYMAYGTTYTGEYSYGLIPENAIPANNTLNSLELGTGLCDDFKAYNIYDLAGNVWEWLAEVGTSASGSNLEVSENQFHEEKCPSEKMKNRNS